MHSKVLMVLLAFGFLFSSCGNIDIVKRKYRPGFHVDISKKRQKTKVIPQAAVAAARKAKKAKIAPPKKAYVVDVKATETMMANAGKAIPSNKLFGEKEEKSRSKKVLQGFANLDFKQWVRNVKKDISPSKSSASRQEWMPWVSFGTGLGSMAFGFLALLTAFIFGWSYLIWFAILLAGAAITFAILYKHQNGTDPKARLGMLFGIIGGIIAFVALIVFIAYLAGAFIPLLY